MDEATSSVDPTTEQAFLSVALSAFAHRTVIIIAVSIFIPDFMTVP